MNFHVLTLFPEMVLQGMGTSIFGRAQEKGLVSLRAVNIRDYTKDRHRKVDDYPYGGGAGMLMQAQPVYDAFLAVRESIGGKAPRVIYLTPQGKQFCQSMAQELATEEDLILLCGHYEGIDERVLQEIVTDYVSVGDFVLTGGELPAMLLMDAVSRLVPGVLHNASSADFDSFHNDLLEYPQYSRPEEWRGKKVPEILLSGDHKKIEQWRLAQSVKKTEKYRPDLYEKYRRRQYFTEKLLKLDKWLYIDMAESLRRGRGELLYAGEDGLIIIDRQGKVCMLAAFQESFPDKLCQALPVPEGIWQYVVHQESLLKPLGRLVSISKILPIYQAAYPQKTPLPVSGEIEIRPLTLAHLSEVTGHYGLTDIEYIKERLNAGEIYGAFLDGEPVGFAGTHKEGSIGLLEVYREYRKRGVGTALEAFLINHHLSLGHVPYGDIVEDNEISLRLQEKLGLKISGRPLYWVTAEKKLAICSGV